MNNSDEPIGERIGYVLKQVQAALRSELDAVLATHGLTTPQYAALSALEREPGLSNAELSRRSLVTPQSMLRIVEHLEASGLLQRTPRESHARVLSAALSPKGRKLVASCHHDVQLVERRLLRPLSAKERRQLLDLLTRCADGFAP